jgi:hypothetical protein
MLVLLVAVAAKATAHCCFTRNQPQVPCAQPPLALTLTLQDAAEVPEAMEEDSSTTQDDGKAAAAASELAVRVSGLPEVELYLYLLLLLYLIDKERHTQVGATRTAGVDAGSLCVLKEEVGGGKGYACYILAHWTGWPAC